MCCGGSGSGAAAALSCNTQTQTHIHRHIHTRAHLELEVTTTSSILACMYGDGEREEYVMSRDTQTRAYSVEKCIGLYVKRMYNIKTCGEINKRECGRRGGRRSIYEKDAHT